MDVLYILGDGSRHDNRELMYSLRSIEKHLKGVGNVIVLGINPGFLSNEVIYYPYKDAPHHNKEYRIARKILFACEMGLVKGDFLFMNDDIFFHKDADAATYPNYYRGMLAREHHNTKYRTSLRHTEKHLLRKGFDTKDFDTHCPKVYNADKFKKLKPHFEVSRTLSLGFVVNSIYCNVYEVPPVFRKDIKLEGLVEKKDKDRIKVADVFSCSDDGFGNGVEAYLKELFPNKSKFER